MTLIWPTLSTTRTRRRSRTQMSTQSRNPHTPRSPDVLMTAEISTHGRSHPRLAHSLAIQMVEISTPGRSHPPLAHSLATRTEEVTSVMGTMAGTRPGPSPGPQQVEVATTPVKMVTGPPTVEGAIDQARMDIIMVEAATTHTAIRTATRSRGSCLPSCPSWW